MGVVGADVLGRPFPIGCPLSFTNMIEAKSESSNRHHQTKGAFYANDVECL